PHRPCGGEGGDPARAAPLLQAPRPPACDPPFRDGDVVEIPGSEGWGGDEVDRGGGGLMATRRPPAMPAAHLIREAEAISAGAVVLVASIAALAGLLSGGRGGWLGGFAGVALGDLLGAPGALLLLAVVLVVAFVLATGVSAIEASGRAARWVGATVHAGARRLRRGPSAAEASPEPGPARRAKLPILLDDALDPPPEAPADRPPPIIREPEHRPEPPRRARRSELQEELFAEDTYRLPAHNLLDPPVRTAQPLDEAALHTSSRILETKLADFQAIGRVVAVRPGPVITTFEFEPAAGVKVNRIVT